MGLQAAGRRGEQAPDSSIVAMAERYVACMLARSGPRPFWLAGYSLGGLVALEMARVLRRQGEPVAGLILVDPKLRVPLADRRASARYSQLRVDGPASIWGRLAGRAFALPPEHDGVAMLRVAGRELQAFSWRQRLTYLRGLGNRLIERRRLLRAGGYDPALYRAQLAAFVTYWPEPLALNSLLLWCPEDGDQDERRAILAAWQAALGPHLAVQTFSGTHQSMAWEPRVENLATAMGAFLAAGPGGAAR